MFVRDLHHYAIRVSVTNTGAESNRDSHRSAITGDSGQVAFDSAATNLVIDHNIWVDVFVTPYVRPPLSDAPVPVVSRASRKP